MVSMDQQNYSNAIHKGRRVLCLIFISLSLIQGHSIADSAKHTTDGERDTFDEESLISKSN